MGLFGFGKEKKKKPKLDPREREKRAGGREYEARRQERLAERLDSEGDAAGAKVARDAAEAARRPQSRGNG